MFGIVTKKSCRDFMSEIIPVIIAGITINICPNNEFFGKNACNIGNPIAAIISDRNVIR
jgi:hypothetical protein